MLDLDILKLFLIRTNYLNYYKFLKKDLLSYEAELILNDIEAYWEKDSVEEHINLDTFTTWFFQFRHPDFKRDKAEVYRKILSSLSEPCSASTDVIINSWKRYELDSKLALLAKDTKPIDYYYAELDNYKKTQSLTDPDFLLPIDLNTIIQFNDTKNGLNWNLPELQNGIGPVTLGTFGVIAARPNAGKTSFVASEVAGLVKQLKDDEIIVWLNNENRAEKIMVRIYCAILNKRWDEIVEHKEEAEKQFIAAGGNKIRVLDFHGKSTKDVEKLLEMLNCRLLIIDMLDHLKGFSTHQNETSDTRYDKLYQWALELSCNKCPVLVTSQLRGDAEGLIYPTMDQLKGSTTAKQGAASFILMIGKSNELGCENSRYLSAPKNKYGSGYFQVEVVFDAQRSRYRSPGECHEYL